MMYVHCCFRILSEAHELTVFPNLAGSNGLERITLDRASITELPSKLCQNLQQLTVLYVSIDYKFHFKYLVILVIIHITMFDICTSFDIQSICRPINMSA